MASPRPACPACAASALPKFLFRVSNETIVGCPSCGLGLVDGAPSRDTRDLYDEGYFTADGELGYADYEGSEPVLRSEFARTVSALGQHVPRGRLVEIGAAFGFFLLEARSRYASVGVEVSEPAARAARARGLDVRTGVYDEPMAEAVGEVDACVMLDVIEHLTQPFDVVSRVSRYLAPGGVLMLTTGDFGSIVSRLAGKRWRLMTPPEHLYFFTEASLRALLTRAGLQVVEVVRPWKVVPLGLALHQAVTKLGLPAPAPRLGGVGVPLNLFDAMRVVARKLP
jgi:SAM-dependent methyltransferase